MAVQEALTELLTKDKSLLKDSKALVAALKEHAVSGVELARFSKALSETNIGEALLDAGESGPDALLQAKSDAVAQLQKINLPTESATSIVQALSETIRLIMEQERKRKEQEERERRERKRKEREERKRQEQERKEQKEQEERERKERKRKEREERKRQEQERKEQAERERQERERQKQERREREQKEREQQSTKAAADYFDEGVAAIRDKEYDKAVDAFTRAIALNPKHAGTYFNRGAVYATMQNHGQAIADFTQAIFLSPKDADIYYNRGISYSRQEDYDKAIADFTQAIALAPDFADAYYYLGLSHVDKNEYDLAIVDYTKAIARDPGHAYAFYNRGLMYAFKDDYDLAIADFTKALALATRDFTKASIYSSRGNSYYQKGDYDKAIADYKQALELGRNSERDKKNLQNAIDAKNRRGKISTGDEISEKPIPGTEPLPPSKTDPMPPTPPNKTGRKGFSTKTLLLIALAVIIIGLVAYDSPNSSSNKEHEKTVSTSSTTTKENKKRDASETSLDGIEIGMTAKELISSRGIIEFYDNEPFPGYDSYDYGKVKVVIKGERVCAITSNEPTVTTKKGIHTGSSEKELKDLYGNTSTIYFNQRLYEFTSNDKKHCYIGFEVGNGVVRNITIADRDVYDFLAARHSLVTFHSLITKRDYDSAYDYFLTGDMKRQLGNYNDWKAGYRTTVSSEIKKINSVRKRGDDVEIAYDLEAVDNPGGTHYFTGKVIIKKNGGWWAIDSMENR